MNKKFLSAILFGALMVTSTGTFVSCKDYDDDLENLQTQIDKNSSAIAELQKLVGSGNWVTSISPVAGGFTVTMSNGQSQTITGINGADGKDGQDGKNGTEWTIGEDGYWYMDGEKTENLAVGKNGENGVTAPSPSISANGNWVLYTWDAEKGEFVAEETTIPAQGTAAYVVLKNGAYILHIADENGEYQEVALPATAESFTINGISNTNVNVVFAYGEWKAPTSRKDKELFAKLVAEFPELEDYEDGQLVEQGGKLPFIVSPANVELTKDHSFALIDMKGKNAGATLSNPVKGMPEGLETIPGSDGNLDSKAAQGTAVWSLDFVPALSEKKNEDYVANPGVLYSLVISGPKGEISSTPYVYSYTIPAPTTDFTLAYTGAVKKYNEDGMDIFEALPNMSETAIALPENTLRGKYILEATDPAQVEEYGIEIEGSVVTIANMPKGKNISGIKLQLTAVAVNGKVATDDFTLAVNNEIAATGALADLEEVLAGSYSGSTHSTSQTIWWSLDKLNLSAVQMRSLVDAASSELKIYNEDNVVVYNSNSNASSTTDDVVTFYETKNKAKYTKDYTKAAYIAATINVADEDILPGDYTVVLTAGDGTNTILKAESNLTLVNPEEDLIAVKESFVDEEGVIIAAAYANSSSAFQFDIADALSLSASSSIASYEDLDYGYDDVNYNVWLKSYDKTNPDAVVTSGVIIPTMENFATTTVDSEVDKVHTFKVTYKLFGNTKNTKEIEVKVKWASSIFAADASDVITMTAAKLAAVKFDNVDGTDADESQLDLGSITSAIYAQGTKKGTKYTLIGHGATGGGSKYKKTLYDSYKKDDSGVYPLSSTGTPIAIADANLIQFGMSVTEYQSYNALATKPAIYLTAETQYLNATTFLPETQTATSIELCGWDDLAAEYLTYYEANATTGAYALKSNYTTAPESVKLTLFAAYDDYLVFDKEETGFTSPTTGTVVPAPEIESVNFKFVNEEDAAYFTAGNVNPASNYAATSLVLDAKPSAEIDVTSLIENKKVVPMQMIVTDKWGKKMTYDFEVTISL